MSGPAGHGVGPTQVEGRPRFSLRRIKSHSKLFGNGSRTSLAGSADEEPPAPPKIGGWLTGIASLMNSPAPPLPSPLPVRAARSAHSSVSNVASSTRFGPIDRIAQFLFDPDASTPDRDAPEHDIWVLGVRHPGAVALPVAKKTKRAARSSTSSSPRLDSSVSTSSLSSSSSSNPSSSDHSNPPSGSVNGWPVSFYSDFYSRLALTYRSGFPGIPCARTASTGMSGVFNSLSISLARGGFHRSSSSGASGERRLTTDTGWGCMLRTGQSLLANALMDVHLGRDWRRTLPSSTSGVQDKHATYVQLLTLFLDSPSPLSPFSVHAFALSGLSLGKSVGEWFGPSTASGTIRSLVNGVPASVEGMLPGAVGMRDRVGMGVVEAVSGEVYKSLVEDMASTGSEGSWSRPVLVLIGVRLGIDGVNPIYYDSIKAIFSFPQSVGIAGGRPSSSYYFVGAQSNSLFYIDPHHSKPSVDLQVPEGELGDLALRSSLGDWSDSTGPRTGGEAALEEMRLEDSFVTVHQSVAELSTPTRSRKHSAAPSLHTADLPESFLALPSPLDTLDEVVVDVPGPEEPPTTAKLKLKEFYETAYSDAQLRSYHCDKVRKMAMSSLDPSMLLGFLIKDEADWEDFSLRVKLLSQASTPIFAIADAPPAWMQTRSPANPFVSSPSPRRPPLSSTGDSSMSGFSEEAEIPGTSEDDWDNDSTGDDSDSPANDLERGESPLPDEADWDADVTSDSLAAQVSHVEEGADEEDFEGTRVASSGTRREESWYSTSSPPSSPEKGTLRRSAAPSPSLLSESSISRSHSPTSAMAEQDEAVLVARPAASPCASPVVDGPQDTPRSLQEGWVGVDGRRGSV